ncbi:MAB_1171c family putative transporter [Amycolatopsis sp. NPDC049691]|uniref:MAB_1171c family putative transporter n=1 Tax=Amycolatopsis sp. NPDC049691 TaxID=3155155 RepID=UPI00341F016E
MAVTPLVLAYGIVSGVLLLWLAGRLARNPRNTALRSVTALVACLAVAFPFGAAADKGAHALGLPPMISRLIQHGLLLVGVYSLVCFFLFSARERATARRRAGWYAALLLGAEVVLLVAALATPVSARTNDQSVPSVAVFFIAADVFMAVGFATAAVWAWRYAREAGGRLARGLRIAAVGLVAIVLANCVFVPAIVLGLVYNVGVADRAGSAGTVVGAIAVTVLLMPGVLLFLAGVSYPALMTRVGAVRVWWRHRRGYRQLAPLWTVLHSEFPDDALDRVPAAPWRDALRLRGTHRRYYRRVVECRDGLVRISPYLARTDASADLPSRLQEALAAHAAGESVPAKAVPVALPEGDGLDADVRELVRLARGLEMRGAG